MAHNTSHTAHPSAEVTLVTSYYLLLKGEISSGRSKLTVCKVNINRRENQLFNFRFWQAAFNVDA